MKVECESLESFFENLTAHLSERGSTLFRNTIWFQTAKIPQQEDPYAEALVFLVVFRASAIVDGPDYQYLVDVGLTCGKDYMDGNPELKGSEQATEHEEALREFAEDKGLRLLSGAISQA